ncbi:D-glycero-beta-D-manno-heptose 1,7-bisphosphate 7-phosphatase [Thermoflexus sp.]|uniref:D-glycero-beta-D-manno-heptose 1,7-bisphosphate 7-phosphatase n=1 Tax=Thermoflexus sp. TaxID=1969742 RepID=UPI0025D667D1|nr:D-glycero-beta-D-manno-heptose 1,7-bisphosphate 7-phosphatase [Thermoflexus sp.]MCS6964811.1 D-glycero-beta-D-manno-heptose 1,7-bisphosphate 7-phosphatase [Thermoflexus sp.]MCS7352029.1 D-glycero-beta-D-manno-heptose 1,7-bisphosphate 7-phosphatase [Thermoflexus sp.]MCX7691655.1 D-glycero-beta-D-manno-heptose 1,7-bisphosphate 7-phosphatase [Thermoflexus sp.]MDW8181488.1 D-glycero-beta-D-manno-heptose 1,7-bisphosphate 7-phosphatase [Anaerolineae bacterium]
MRAVFLDRDGVICENRPDHVKSWTEFRFLPGALQALRRLSAAPFSIVVVTNQAIVHRGIVPAAVVEEIHRWMIRDIQLAGGRVDAIYYCPHRPEEDCLCRKPKPGLLLQAARDLGIRLEASYLIGDALTDVEAALAAGCQPLLVRTGRGALYAQQVLQRYPEVQIFQDLSEAVSWILHREVQILPTPALRVTDVPLATPLG